jgi:hypothetical protein
MIQRFKDNRAKETKPAIIIPIYQAAIDGQEASFPLLLKLRRDLKMTQQEEGGEELSQALGWYYSRAYHIFGQTYGSITELHLMDDGSAIALTKKNHYLSNYCITNDTYFDRLLLQCDQMATEANRILRGKDLQACTQVLYSAAKTLLCVKQWQQTEKIKDKKSTENLEGCLKVVKNHLDYAREYHLRAARLSAERFYSWGMLLGILLAVVVLRVLGKMSLPEEMQSIHVLASLVGGGMGAVVSVMWRMTNGRLTVRHEVERWTLILVGSFRPLIGAIFGLLVYALIQSNLLPLAVASNSELYFYGVIGFLAGFSERWAPDLLQTTENGLHSATVSPPAETMPTPAQQMAEPISVNGHTTLAVQP